MNDKEKVTPKFRGPWSPQLKDPKQHQFTPKATPPPTSSTHTPSSPSPPPRAPSPPISEEVEGISIYLFYLGHHFVNINFQGSQQNQSQKKKKLKVLLLSNLSIQKISKIYFYQFISIYSFIDFVYLFIN